jgi:hypothetical protein
MTTRFEEMRTRCSAPTLALYGLSRRAEKGAGTRRGRSDCAVGQMGAGEGAAHVVRHGARVPVQSGSASSGRKDRSSVSTAFVCRSETDVACGREAGRLPSIAGCNLHRGPRAAGGGAAVSGSGLCDCE